MFKKYADEMMDFVKKIEADGPRLPGSDEEKAACKKIQGEILDRTGLSSKTENFMFAPVAGIGAIYRLGWACLIALFVYYIGGLYGTILAGAGYIGIMTFVGMQIIRYTAKWDWLFKHEKADNIITELPPVDGETKYTVFLTAHYDSSWCWKLSLKNPTMAIPKTAYGVLSAIAMIGVCIVRACNEWGVFGYGNSYTAVRIVTMLLPLLFIPGFIFITQYTSMDKTLASPGAMDNLSGIGCNMMLMKYFKEHPEDMPKGMRLVDVGFAAEEASLKGSLAFLDAHRNDGTFDNAYVINVDSIADPDHFEAIIGDFLQGTKFDKHLGDLVIESMKDCGIENPKKMYNPVGGCDSTPFCNAGIRTITVAAQNPTTTYYYHTCKDTSDRIDVSTFEKGLEVVYTLVKKIAAEEEAK